MCFRNSYARMARLSVAAPSNLRTNICACEREVKMKLGESARSVMGLALALVAKSN